MHLSTVSEWFAWIAAIHPTEIELGLDRIKTVAHRLHVLTPSIPVIIIGGTNGKGSTVAGLAAIYRAAGYHVGAFTSPFLFRPNEQVRIDEQFASDAEFCHAFEQIEKVRGDITLTPFEFTTLAALCIFKTYALHVLILEVGLGGRLDAVNIFDADIAVITSIGIDHVDWLGSTREEIAREKAGIFRKNKPAIYGDSHPPETLIECATHIGTPVFYQDRDFHYQENKTDWSWSYQSTRYDGLPINSLLTQNMSIVLMIITLLQKQLPVARNAMDKGLLAVTLPGRIQIIHANVMEIYDVSHNPDAIAMLAKRLDDITCAGKTIAVFSMLADKDIATSIKTIRDKMDLWHAAPLTAKRAATQGTLAAAFYQAEINHVTFFATIQAAYQSAVNMAERGDRIIVFGSFHTVADVWRCRVL